MRFGIGWLALVATWHPVVGGVKLLLHDGQVIEGRSVEREETMYLLTLDTDHVLPIPAPLVAAVERTAEPLPGGLTEAEPMTLAGDPEAAKLPTLTDLMQELKASTSVFRRSIIDPTWVPSSDWDTDPEKGNNFHPVHWYQPPVNPIWEPTSGLGEDVTEFNPVRWYRAPIDPTWRPTDGFARKK